MKRCIPLILSVLALVALLQGCALAQLVNPHVFRGVADLSVQGAGEIFGLAVWKNVVYASGTADTGYPTFFSINASNPDNLSLISTSGVSFKKAFEMKIVEDKLYAASWFRHLRVYDVSNPGHFSLVGSYDASPAFFRLDVANNRAYIVESDNSYPVQGLRIVDTSNLSGMQTISTLHSDDYNVGGVAVRGSYVYWGDGQRLKATNISDETQPYVTSDINLGGYVQVTRIRGDYLYVATNGAGFFIFDISEPGYPVQVTGGHLASTGGMDMVLLGDYAFLAASGGGVATVRISNPSSLVVTTATDVDSQTDAVVAYEYSVSGNGRYIYIGDSEMYWDTQPPYDNYWEGKVYCFEALSSDPDNAGPGKWSNFTPTEASWDIQYEADTLPSATNPAWTLIEGSASWASVSGGVLRINDQGTVLGDKVKWARNWNATNTRGATVLARARCASYTLNGSTIPNIMVCDGKYREEFAILSDKVRANVANIECPLDGTAWHTYRITTQGSQFKLYVDESPTPSLSGTLTMSDSSTRWPRVIFGSGSSPSRQDVYFDYVYSFSDGAYGPSTTTTDLTPDISVKAADSEGKGSLSGIKPSSARLFWSTDGGANWQSSGGNLWDCEYEGSALPSAEASPWTVAEGSETYASVNAGILRVNDNSTASNTKIKWSRSWAAAPSIGTTVVARAQCVSVGGDTTLLGNIFADDGVKRETLCIMPDRIVAKEAGLTYMMDGSQWHVYRMTTRNTQFSVYVDENPSPVLTGTMIAGSTSNRVMFGSGASAGTQDIYFDYVRYTASGDLPPGQGDGGGPVAVTCTGTDGTDRGTVNAYAVPFNQYSETLNRVKFSLRDMNGNTGYSPVYIVRVPNPSSPPPGPVTLFGALGGDAEVNLSWTNPSDAQFTGTTFRYKTTGYPTGPTDGTFLVDKLNSPGSTDTHKHVGVTNGLTYYYAAFAHNGVPSYSTGVSASAAPADAGPPSLVTGFTATPANQRVTLAWTNPSSSDFIATTIRYKTTGYPSGPSDGTLLIDKANTPGSADGYTHNGLVNGLTYYYAAFARDSVPNYAAAATASAMPVASVCLAERFAYPDGNLNGKGGWTGTATSQITVLGEAAKIVGGGGIYASSRAVSCSAGAGGIIQARIKVKAGVGTNNIWSLYIDDPTGKNLARWYGAGTSARPRIGGTGLVLNPVTLTGGWDTLDVKINITTNSDEFFFNGVSLGTLSHSSQGAGDSIGQIRFERMDSGGAEDSYIYLDDLIAGDPDATPPGPVTGFVAYGESGRASLAWTNPADVDLAGVMVLSKTTGYPASPTDGTLIYDSLGTAFVHSGLSNGTKYYYSAFAYDAWSNYSAAASALAHAATDTTIPAAKALPDGQVRALRGNVVSACFAGCFYIQEQNQPWGLMVTSSYPVAVGQIVDVVGVMSGSGTQRSLDTQGNAVKLIGYGP